MPLTQPRQGSVSLGGHPWLARMLDKARLDAEGTIGELDLVYPCPMDQRLLQQLGISPATFQSIATTHSTDDDVLQALADAGAKL